MDTEEYFEWVCEASKTIGGITGIGGLLGSVIFLQIPDV
jgi:hypothetical protein